MKRIKRPRGIHEAGEIKKFIGKPKRAKKKERMRTAYSKEQLAIRAFLWVSGQIADGLKDFDGYLYHGIEESLTPTEAEQVRALLLNIGAQFERTIQELHAMDRKRGKR